MSLLLNAYPKAAFAKAQALAAPFNVLVDRISRDADFLNDTLGGGVSDAEDQTVLAKSRRHVAKRAKRPA